MFRKLFAQPIVVRSNFQKGWTLYAIKKVKTNGKALDDSIQFDWTLNGSKERIN